jgi:hypothetical protein
MYECVGSGFVAPDGQVNVKPGYVATVVPGFAVTWKYANGATVPPMLRGRRLIAAGVGALAGWLNDITMLIVLDGFDAPNVTEPVLPGPIGPTVADVVVTVDVVRDAVALPGGGVGVATAVGVGVAVKTIGGGLLLPLSHAATKPAATTIAIPAKAPRRRIFESFL